MTNRSPKSSKRQGSKNKTVSLNENQNLLETSISYQPLINSLINLLKRLKNVYFKIGSKMSQKLGKLGTKGKFNKVPLLGGVTILTMIITILISKVLMSGLGELNLKMPAVSFKPPAAISDFYLQEEKTYFDPVELKAILDQEKPNILIIDLRLKNDFSQKHLKGAINIPVYQIPFVESHWPKNKSEFLKKVKTAFKGKREIILYGYQPRAKTNLEIASFLNQNGLKTRILSISFYDWQNNFYQWLPGAQNGGLNMEKYMEGETN